SIAAVEEAMATEDKNILVFAQKSADVNEPTPGDLYAVGTKATIKKVSRVSRAMNIVVYGLERVTIGKVISSKPFLRVEARPLETPSDAGPEVDAMLREVVSLTMKIQKMAQPDAQVQIP